MQRRWRLFLRDRGQLALQFALLFGFPCLVVIFAWDRARPWEAAVRYMAMTQYAGHAPRAAALLKREADEPLLHELAGFRHVWLVEGELAPSWKVWPAVMPNLVP